MKLFFLGIDSADWKLIKPWVKQGKLPGFKKLIDDGLITNLESTLPPLTPIAWSSLYTGANAGKHGVFDFYKLDNDKKLFINLATDRKLPSFFKILSDSEKKITAINMPLTFPVENVNGVMIGGFLSPGLDSQFIHPGSLAKEFKNKFPDYHFSTHSRHALSKESKLTHLLQLLNDAHQKIEVADWLESKDSWDFFGINFMEVDHVQHWYWRFMDETHPQYKHDRELSTAILRVYQLIDSYLLRKLNDNVYDSVIIFSDHGAGKYIKSVNVNSLFLRHGLIKAKSNWTSRLKLILFKMGFSPHFAARIAMKLNVLPKPGHGESSGLLQNFFFSLKDIDWVKSKAFSFGYYGQIYLLNKSNMTKRRVIKALNSLKYDGIKVVDKIWDGQQIYSCPEADNAPDIVFSPMNFSFGSSAISPFLSYSLFTSPHTLKSGDHRINGIFGLYQRKKTLKKLPEKVSIYDVSASILDFFNVDILNFFDGKSFFKRGVMLDSVVDEINV